jgi:hypothetical protein
LACNVSSNVGDSMRQRVGIDSNALTLLIEAVDPNFDPRADSVDLAEEKKAILRAFLYKRIAYYIGPTVEAEYKKIKINEKIPGTCLVLRYFVA